ncbi:acyl-CoA N-acyltransferase [Hypoxylon sp. NC0597]|nr:acyl-CoA N-acyltransferase [Hypoxylon sp. NC0597]
MAYPISIEIARLSDAASIANVATRAAPLQYQNTGLLMTRGQLEDTVLSAWTMRQVQTRLMHPKKCTLVARDLFRRIVGFCTVCFEEKFPFASTTYNDEEWTSIDALYVDPTVHRHRIRSRLLEAVESFLREKGNVKIWLAVLEGNEAAINLYRKSGYVVVGGTNFPSGFGIPNDYIMAKYSNAV